MIYMMFPMTYLSKSIVLLSVVMCGLLTWSCVLRAMNQGAVETYEGYFAPVYSPDGQYVYFVERRTSGTAKETRPSDFFFSSSTFDVFVAKDTFSLKRLHVQSGQVEELIRLSPSPIEGQHYEVIGSPFQFSDARLRFTKGQQLEFNVCLTAHHAPRAKEYSSSGVWSQAQHAAKISRSWEESPCEMSGYDEWPLFGASELMEVRAQRGLFPVAIVAYNHATRGVKVLVKSKDYDRLYPNGVPLQQMQENSRRSGIERDQVMRQTHEALLQKYKAMGMGEVQALLRTGKDMQRLGYYPKTPTIVARRLGREEAARTDLDKDALFSIAKGEMESGIFQDIERAIASPGQEIDRDSTDYLTHRDYSTSARLNAFLNTGKTRFYVRYLGDMYELTIAKPSL
jgi:hypothetical protein